jgi:hypothetical protein
VWQWDGEKWKATGTTSSIFSGSTVVFEGATDDIHETTLTVVDPTADRTITLPNATGTVALTSDLTTYAPLASPAFTGGATITDTDTTVSYGPILDLYRDGTHANHYHLGTIMFTGQDENDAKQTYGQINARIEEYGADAFGDLEFWIGYAGAGTIQRNMVIDDYWTSITHGVRIGSGSDFSVQSGDESNERTYDGYWAKLRHDGNNYLTADRTFYVPDSSGTIALADDANSIIAGQMF